MEHISWVFWIVMMVVFAALEAATVNLVSVWFVGGALAGLVVSLLGGSGWWQVGVFLAVSGVMLAGLRPFVRKYVSPKRTATNADMAIGRQAYLTERVDNLHGTGTLKLDGREWSVRSASGEILEAGTLVTVVSMEGVRLFVEPTRTAAAV